MSWLSPVLLAWVLGNAVQLFQTALSSAETYLWTVLIAILLSGTIYKLGRRLPAHTLAYGAWQYVAGISSLCTVAAMGYASVGWRAVHYQQSALPANLQGIDLTVTGTVVGLPQRHADGWRFRFEVKQAVVQDSLQQMALPPLLQVGWYANDSLGQQALPVIRSGQIWHLPLRLKQPHGLLNPGGFDTELWFWQQGIHASASVRTSVRSQTPKLESQTSSWTMGQLRQSARDGIHHSVNDARWAALVSALLVGDQSGLDRADWEVFRATGVAHLMSISGLHITLWAWVARWLIQRLWCYSDIWGRSWCLWLPAPHAAQLGGLLLATLYAVFSGWGIPSQRTVAMLATVCILNLQALRWPMHTQWLLAMVVVLLMDPWALMQAGFWLSFMAVAMLFMTPSPQHKPRMGQYLWSLVQEQWRLGVCLAPLGMVLFQQVSLVGLVANLFAIPWITWVVTPLAFAGLLWSPLWQASAWAGQIFLTVLEPLAQLPWAVWHSAAPPMWVAAVGLLGAGLWAGSKYGLTRWTGLALLLPSLYWPSFRPLVGSVELLAADVGQGNAVLVRTAQHSLLFDAGPRYGSESDAGERVWQPLLQRMGERLNVMVLSHQDADHTGGALAVYQAQSQAKVLSSITTEHWLGLRLPVQRCEAGQSWQWDDVTFTVLHPLRSDYDKLLPPNARSCVLRIHAQGQTVLLAADIEAQQEKALVERMGDNLRADVLLVPHHGSKTSSTVAFLEAVQPRIAWVQAGYRNRYGHPAPQVMQRYKEQGIPVWDSPRCGAMHWRSDTPTQVVCERDVQRRYWHHQWP